MLIYKKRLGADPNDFYKKTQQKLRKKYQKRFRRK
jgi:hypothetical protein